MNQIQVKAHIYQIINGDARFDVCVVATSSTIASLVVKNRYPTATIYYKSVCEEILQSNETVVIESSSAVVA